MAWFALLFIFAHALFGDLYAGQLVPHMAAPVIFNNNDPTDSPRIWLTLFGEEQEFLFDTGTDPTLFFHRRVIADQDALAGPKGSDGLYRGIPLQEPFEGIQIEHAMEIVEFRALTRFRKDIGPVPSGFGYRLLPVTPCVFA